MAFRIKIPDIMPVLSHGNHDAPTHGACFMEYTALLAGEPFTDRPRCVDHELSSVMMWINDSLPDVDRHLLVPFLGRGIGLVYPRQPRPIPGVVGLISEEQEAAVLAYRERVTKWETKADEFRRSEVIPRLLEKLPKRDAVDWDRGPLSNRVCYWFANWSNETGNKIIDTEDGRHDFQECYNDPERCRHHLEPKHRAGVDILLQVADALHTAYEEAMEARGWSIKGRDPVCELPDVMKMINQGQ